jgi:hypothetical protein
MHQFFAKKGLNRMNVANNLKEELKNNILK